MERHADAKIADGEWEEGMAPHTATLYDTRLRAERGLSGGKSKTALFSAKKKDIITGSVFV